MAFDFINYAKIDPQNLPSGLSDIFKNALEGYRMGRAPEDMRIERQKSLADAMLQGLKTQAFPEQNRADLAYKQSETYKNMHPELFQAFSGPAAEAMSLQRLVDKYGENSDVVQQARSILKSNQDAQASTIARNNALSSTQAFRASTPLNKLYTEQADVQAGYVPGTNRTQRLTPDEQEEMLGQYGLAINKKNTDAKTRALSLAGDKLETTLNAIDVDALTQYAGANGLKKLSQDAQAPFGKESPEYKKYQVAVNQAILAADQARQQLGTSVSIEMNNLLTKLTNPATYKNNPEIAAAQFNEFKRLMKQENALNKAAMRSADVYKEKSTSSVPTESARTWDNQRGGWVE